jgi:hypothetical protein
MASVIYTQHTADGKSHQARRSVPQGRKPSPPELLQTRRVTINLTERQYRQLVEGAKSLNMKPAAYGALAVSLFMQLFAANNCSSSS